MRPLSQHSRDRPIALGVLHLEERGLLQGARSRVSEGRLIRARAGWRWLDAEGGGVGGGLGERHIGSLSSLHPIGMGRERVTLGLRTIGCLSHVWFPLRDGRRSGSERLLPYTTKPSAMYLDHGSDFGCPPGGTHATTHAFTHAVPLAGVAPRRRELLDGRGHKEGTVGGLSVQLLLRDGELSCEVAIDEGAQLLQVSGRGPV